MPVYGKAVAFVQNRDGGRIIITDQDCDGKVFLKQAYATDAQGDAHFGCWTFNKVYIRIKWMDTPRAINYPISLFVKADGA